MDFYTPNISPVRRANNGNTCMVSLKNALMAIRICSNQESLRLEFILSQEKTPGASYLPFFGIQVTLFW